MARSAIVTLTAVDNILLVLMVLGAVGVTGFVAGAVVLLRGGSPLLGVLLMVPSLLMTLRLLFTKKKAVK